MKLSNQNQSGTSFQDVTITTTVKKLIEKIGEPQYKQNSGEDKVNFEWVCETKDGTVFTIYDWKEYRELILDETIEFHIGSHSEEISNKAQFELLILLAE